MGDPLMFVIDAGGTSTRMAIVTDSGVSDIRGLPSLNDSSVGWDEAALAAALVFERLAAELNRLGSLCVRGLMANAAIWNESLHLWHEVVERAMNANGLVGTVVLTNDVVPHLLGEPLRGCGLAISVGTGSCVLGSADGRHAFRVGGAEFLASDEGGAYYVGRLGLVAGFRSFDGRGERTSIRRRLEERFAMSIEQLAITIAKQAHPKVVVGSIASSVVAAWLEDADLVAMTIIDQAIDELVDMVRCACHKISADPASRIQIVLAGNVTADCPEFVDRLISRIRVTLDRPAHVWLVRDALQPSISMLRANIGPISGIPWLVAAHR